MVMRVKPILFVATLSFFQTPICYHYKVPLSRIVTSNRMIVVRHNFHITFIHLEILLQHNIVIDDYNAV